MILFLFQDAVNLRTVHWWEVVTGILAIPAAIIGLRYSYQLTQKTRLEITKTELEIEEKRRTLGMSSPSPAPIEATPANHRSKITDLLILRFIILYLFGRLWGLADDAVRSAIFGAGFFILNVLGWHSTFESLDRNNVALFGAYVLSKIPDVLYWVISFALAWPLFKDVNRGLGLRFADYLPWKRKR